jgi:hypothetical protein
MLARWFSTVLALMHSRSAICCVGVRLGDQLEHLGLARREEVLADGLARRIRKEGVKTPCRTLRGEAILAPCDPSNARSRLTRRACAAVNS